MNTQRRGNIICDLLMTEFTVSMIGDQTHRRNFIGKKEVLCSAITHKVGHHGMVMPNDWLSAISQMFHSMLIQPIP